MIPAPVCRSRISEKLCSCGRPLRSTRGLGRLWPIAMPVPPIIPVASGSLRVRDASTVAIECNAVSAAAIRPVHRRCLSLPTAGSRLSSRAVSGVMSLTVPARLLPRPWRRAALRLALNRSTLFATLRRGPCGGHAVAQKRPLPGTVYRALGLVDRELEPLGQESGDGGHDPFAARLVARRCCSRRRNGRRCGLVPPVPCPVRREGCWTAAERAARLAVCPPAVPS